MKQHLAPCERRFRSLGLDVRTRERKREDARLAEQQKVWALRAFAARYDMEKIYGEIWTEPIQKVAKRYGLSDVGLAKVCRKLNIPRPGRGYWAIKAAGKPVPRRPALPKLEGLACTLETHPESHRLERCSPVEFANEPNGVEYGPVLEGDELMLTA